MRASSGSKNRPLTHSTPKERTLAKVDHAFGQLRQMKDGQLQGVNAEDLLDEL